MEEPGAQVIDNHYVARVLGRIAEMLEFRDENPFKIRSYRLASETIDAIQEPVAEMVAGGGAAELQKIPGIGKSLSSQIIEILHTGRSSYFEELTRDVPATVLDLRRVSGIGLKTAQLLYRDFGVKSLDDLKSFCAGGGLTSVQGIGPKTIERISRSLTRIESEH
jgi:DNA polymerase (family 10)